MKVKVFDPLAPFAGFDKVYVHEAELVAEAKGKVVAEPIEPKYSPREDPIMMASKLASAALRIHVYLYGPDSKP